MEQRDILTIDTTSGSCETKKTELFDIYSDKHPFMRQVIPSITEAIPNKTLDDIIDRLILTRKTYGGVGLAANQCGVPLRVFVIGTDSFDMVCINPEILEDLSFPKQGKEGCLSFPGLFLKIKRPESIMVRYTDRKGDVVEQQLDGLTARCFQHELDHLNGITITDYAGRMKMMMAKKKQEKLIKSIKRRGLTNGLR